MIVTRKIVRPDGTVEYEDIEVTLKSEIKAKEDGSNSEVKKERKKSRRSKSESKGSDEAKG